VPAGFGHELGGLLGPFPDLVRRDDRGTLLGEEQRGGSADAGPAAGDEGDAVGEGGHGTVSYSSFSSLAYSSTVRPMSLTIDGSAS
jgi:hypothetical protein